MKFVSSVPCDIMTDENYVSFVFYGYCNLNNELILVNGLVVSMVQILHLVTRSLWVQIPHSTNTNRFLIYTGFIMSTCFIFISNLRPVFDH